MSEGQEKLYFEGRDVEEMDRDELLAIVHEAARMLRESEQRAMEALKAKAP